jgi:SAM-dependent methyltransferase
VNGQEKIDAGSPGAGSYPETADVETASEGYARRFAGPTGEWFLRTQARTTLRLLSDAGCRTVLDVGGGHGQLAVPLAERGDDVTVVGSDPVCRSRVAALVETGRCRFVVGNLIALPFADRSFDASIAFRLATHCARWPELIGELCRVARRCVIIDYPTSQSINVLAPSLFAAKKRIESNTRTWIPFRHADIHAEFERHGFRIAARHAQFFLPMVLHRALRCQPLSACAEMVFRSVGLTRALGSPVIVQAAREAP